MALARTLAGCRSWLVEQGQLEVAGAGPLAIAPPLAAPPFTLKTGQDENQDENQVGNQVRHHAGNHGVIYSGRGGCGFLAGARMRGRDCVRVGSGNRVGSGSLFSRSNQPARYA
ncbi:MAG: hypothetical protein H0V72_03035 [Bradyrhizobium sp.]|nr:hypothetical protein [Bradyrhizobium sp.]